MMCLNLKTTLKNGTSVFFRSLNPCDREGIIQGFEELSAQSKYFRFFTPIKHLSDTHLADLIDPDNFNHVVVAATIYQEKQERGDRAWALYPFNG